MSYDYCRLTNKFEHTYRNQNPASKLSMDDGEWSRQKWVMLRGDLGVVRRIVGEEGE